VNKEFAQYSGDSYVAGYIQARKTTDSVGKGDVQIVTLSFLMKCSFEEIALQTGTLLQCKIHLFDQSIADFQYNNNNNNNI
jgi:hypothetical protein